MRFFYDTGPDEIKEWVKEKSLPAYRAGQILKWKQQGITSFDEMTNIPVSVRSLLSEDYYADGVVVASRSESKADGTVKYVLRLLDSNVVECVLMRYSYGNSVCISSQAGCKMGCSFCASAKAGFGRDLSSGEMLFQVLAVAGDIGERISNIVVMGIGEPLDNYDELVRFIKDANDNDIQIGRAHV